MRHYRYLSLTALACCAFVSVGCRSAAEPGSLTIDVSPADTTVLNGTAYRLRVTTRRDGMLLTSGVHFLFSSDDVRVATVDTSGLVQTMFGGTTTIRVMVSASGQTARANAIVRAGSNIVP